MKRPVCLFLLIGALIAASLVTSRRAQAITYGFVDSNNTYSNGYRVGGNDRAS